jgi:Flp pilus assembly protein TadG
VAAVEFALVAPVFLVLIFGMIEFGRAIMVQQTITNASREGARVAVLDGTTTTLVTTTINNYLSNCQIAGATVSMLPTTPSTAAYGDPVTVTVSVRFEDVSWLPSPWFLAGKTLSAQTVMRRETVQ